LFPVTADDREAAWIDVLLGNAECRRYAQRLDQGLSVTVEFRNVFPQGVGAGPYRI